jgi:hypothetical protein
MEFLIMGIATAFNFGILKWKFEHNRMADLVFDVAVLLALSYLFAGTMGGMIISMVASAVVSLYLLISPPKFSLFDDEISTI